MLGQASIETGYNAYNRCDSSLSFANRAAPALSITASPSTAIENTINNHTTEFSID
ncbi:glycosyl transferase group 1 [Pseudomonas sp. StFLB209]|nr:glycosyl transferase group 1 [Pseudomonas sp. StFLB209]